MGVRRRAREYAVQMLYQVDQVGGQPSDQFPAFWDNQPAAEPDVRSFAERLVEGVCAERVELDRLIAAGAEHWKLDRIAVVERNILRLAAYEISHGEDTPPAVAIDEAIEIGKRFGSAESAPFLNGVLDRIRRIVDREATR